MYHFVFAHYHPKANVMKLYKQWLTQTEVDADGNTVATYCFDDSAADEFSVVLQEHPKLGYVEHYPLGARFV